MPTDAAVIVKLEAVEKIYKQGKIEVPALRGLDLEVRRGEFMALTGPSGSGKTTALNLIGGLDVPTRGKVLVDDRDLATMSRGELSRMRRDKIGFVFQAYNLVPVLTAYENAEMVLRLQGVAAAQRRDKVMQLLRDVGLAGLEHRRPAEMSGGQQQRVAIARAIATDPVVTLADEPTANVDSATAEMLLELMETLNRERQVTFIFSTHDPRVMARARRVVHMVDGAVDSDVLRA
jgi:putative ABC transport system ATP-binding protein